MRGVKRDKDRRWGEELRRQGEPVTRGDEERRQKERWGKEMRKDEERRQWKEVRKGYRRGEERSQRERRLWEEEFCPPALETNIVLISDMDAGDLDLQVLDDLRGQLLSKRVLLLIFLRLFWNDQNKLLRQLIMTRTSYSGSWSCVLGWNPHKSLEDLRECLFGQNYCHNTQSHWRSQSRNTRTHLVCFHGVLKILDS